MRSKLPEEWTVVNLKELSIKITKGTTPSTVGGQFIDKGISYYRSQCITDQKYLDKEKVVYIDEETNGKLERSQLAENDILFSMAGAYLGKTAIVKKSDLPGNTNQAAAVIRLNHLKVDYEYVYYYLNLKSVINYVNSTSSQSAQPNINLGNIGKINIKLAPKKEQQVIAATLSALDDKIENNNRVNENLEQQAQEIFKHWFVDFEFPDENGLPYKSNGGKMVESDLGVIPKDWDIKKLADFIEIKNGKRPPIKKDGKDKEYQYPILGASGVMGYTNEFIYNEPILVIGRVGTHGVVQRIDDKVWTSDNTMVIKSAYYELVNIILSNIDYKSLNRGSTQPLLVQKDIKNQQIALPSEKIIKEFEQIIGSFNKMSSKNNQENKNLAELRDTLLPKLMSGELRIPLDE